jgi:hypothetical protein
LSGQLRPSGFWAQLPEGCREKKRTQIRAADLRLEFCPTKLHAWNQMWMPVKKQAKGLLLNEKSAALARKLAKSAEKLQEQGGGDWYLARFLLRESGNHGHFSHKTLVLVFKSGYGPAPPDY